MSEFPAAHALHLIELLRRFDVPAAALLQGTRLTVEGISAPGARISIADVVLLTERARSLTGEPGLGFHLGLQMRISAHGNLGFAAMTAGTLGEALEMAIRYAPTRTTALSLSHRIDEDEASLLVYERADLGSARDVVLIWLLVGLAQIGRALTGKELVGQLELTLPEPDYFSRFSHLAMGRVRFLSKENRLRFPRSVLDLPLLLSDPVAWQIARAQCERELDALRPTGHAPAVAAVEAILNRDEEFPSLEDVAARLHTSERTLKRRLAAEGTSYSQLLSSMRRVRAEELLRMGTLSVEEVAERLGYSDPANFARAFRRWTGQSPRRFRRPRPAPSD